MNITLTKEKFEAIRNTQGNKAKQALLQEFASDKDFIKVLEFIYNPYKRTGIAEKKLNKKLYNYVEVEINDLGVLIDYLIVNNSGKDEYIKIAQNFVESNEEHAEFIKEVITKTYKCGLNVATINKVIPNLIPTFGVMLATKIEDIKNLEKEDVIATKKLDGFRYTFIKKDGIGYNRSGLPVEGLEEIESIMKKMPDGIYDGELIAIGEFKEAKEQYKATSKLARKKGIKNGLKFVCFDYIENYEDFYNGKCETPCTDRKYKLKSLIDEVHNIDPSSIEFIEYAEVLYEGKYDEEKIMKLTDELTDQGEEGLMLNIAKAPYECKRTKTLIKVKKFYTCDLKVVGYSEAKGEMKGVLGALIVEYKNNTVNVGSGFSLAQRQEFWNRKEELIGMLIEVGYKEETSNEDGGLSLRFPTFKRIRDDKTEVSYN